MLCFLTSDISWDDLIEMKKHSSPQAKHNKKERGGPVIDDFVILADKNPNSSQSYCLQEKVFYLLNCIRQLLGDSYK